MKYTLMALSVAFVLIAAMHKISDFETVEKSKIIKTETLIIKEFVKNGVLASNGHTYNVTVDFDLSTDYFGVVTCHDVLTPWIELTCNINSGDGAAVFSGTKCAVDPDLNLTIQNTSITLVVPEGLYTFL